MRSDNNKSYAYQAGYSALIAASYRHGTVNLSPSIADRQDWGHAWKDYMRGWKAAQRARV